MSDKVQEAREKAEQAQRYLEQAKIDARNAEFEAKERAKKEKLDGIAKIKQVMREAVLDEVVKLKPTAVLLGIASRSPKGRTRTILESAWWMRTNTATAPTARSA